MVMVMTHTCARKAHNLSAKKVPAEPLILGRSPRAQALISLSCPGAFRSNHSRGSHLDLDFPDSTTFGMEALGCGWMSQLFPFGGSTSGGTC